MQTRFSFLSWKKILALTLSFFSIAAFADKATYIASFADFDQRASSAMPVSVVFFGGALTWGEGASDPERTSYRALTEAYLQQKYRKAKFSFYDAAVGGAGSKLGMFRVNSDVLAHKPDLVFVDFTVDDHIDGTDQQTLGSYERILRDLVAEGVPVAEVLFGTRTNFGADWKYLGPERLRDHLELAALYHIAIGNSFPIVQNYFRNKTHTRDEIWPHDDVKVNDLGHQFIFQATRDGLEKAIRQKRLCNFPTDAVFANQYKMRFQFFPAGLPLPGGWRVAKSLRTPMESAEISNDWTSQIAVSGVEDKEHLKPIQFEFSGTFVGILGEADEHGLDFKVRIDGAPIPFQEKKPAWPTSTAKLGGGERFFWHEISDKLSPGRHMIQIEPAIFNGDEKGELRIESICVAGPGIDSPKTSSISASKY